MYVPAASVVVSTTTLGPVCDASGAAADDCTVTDSEEHFEKARCAFVTPAPTVTEKNRVEFFAFSEPENVSVCVDDGGGGAGAAATGAVATDVAVVDPPEFVAVTVMRIAESTSALPSV